MHRFFCAVALALMAVPAASQSQLTGTWTGSGNIVNVCEEPKGSGTGPAVLNVVQNGNAVLGTVQTQTDCGFPLVFGFRGQASGNGFSATPLTPFSEDLSVVGSVSGNSITLSIAGADFTATLTRTSTQPPDSRLTGASSGSGVVVETCKNGSFTYPLSISGSLIHANAIGGALIGTGPELEKNENDECKVGSGTFTVPILFSAVADGGGLSGVLLIVDEEDEGDDDDIEIIPFTGSISGNNLSGGFQDAEVSLTFSITQTAGAVPPMILSFTATPTSVSAGQSSTLAWSTANADSVTISGGVGLKPASGSVSVTPSETTTYTLIATGPGGQAVRQVTVNVSAAAGARVAISAFPRGLLQAAGSSGAVDSFAVSNFGDAPATLSLTRTGSFFSITPTTLVLGPGETATVSIIGIAQPAGTFEGSVAVGGSGSPGLLVPVRLLSVAPPAVAVAVTPNAARTEISAPQGQQTTTDSVSFTNKGAGTVTALAISDVPFITPTKEPVTIGPNETKAISYTIDNARRPDSDSPLGAATGTLALKFFTGGAAASTRSIFGGSTQPPPSTTVSLTVAHVVRPGVAAGGPPPLPSGQSALFVPAFRNVRAVGDLLLANRGTSPLSDLRIFLTGTGAAPATASISQFLPNNSVTFPNLVRTVFGSSLTSGTAQIRTADVSRISAAAIQTNTTSPAGTYGTALPVFRSDRGTSSSGQVVLSGLTKSDTAKTDLYVQEVGGNGGSIEVEFLDAAGNVVSRRTGLSIGGFGLVELLDAATSNVIAARVLNPASSAARISAYALVSDSSTGDGWLVTDPAAATAADTIFVPVFSAGPGAETRIFVTGRGSAAVSVRTDVRTAGGRRRGVGNPANASGSSTISLQPAQTTTINVSSASSGYVALAAPPAAVSVAGRSTRSTSAGTFGSGLPAIPASAALRNGESKRFCAVEDASRASRNAAAPATFRTNLALIETTNASATVRVTLQFLVAGSSLASATARISKDITLTASQSIVLTDLARQVIGPSRDSIGDLRNMILDVEVIGGSGRVIPVLQSFDNGSGDMIVRVD